VEGPAVSFCPSDLTVLNKSHHPPLVIPSAAEGAAVRLGSRTKVSVPLVLPQNRHPERSASQIDCVTQRLWRGVEGPRRCLFYPAVQSFSTTAARHIRPFATHYAVLLRLPETNFSFRLAAGDVALAPFEA